MPSPAERLAAIAARADANEAFGRRGAPTVYTDGTWTWDSPEADCALVSRAVLDRLLASWAFTKAVLALCDEAPTEPHAIEPQYRPVVAAASLRRLADEYLGGDRG